MVGRCTALYIQLSNFSYKLFRLLLCVWAGRFTSVEVGLVDFESGCYPVTKRCCLSWLPNCGGGGGVAGSHPSSTHGAQINFGDLTPYLTYVY
jgi:hypothetical protein